MSYVARGNSGRPERVPGGGFCAPASWIYKSQEKSMKDWSAWVAWFFVILLTYVSSYLVYSYPNGKLFQIGLFMNGFLLSGLVFLVGAGVGSSAQENSRVIIWAAVISC